MQLTALDSLLWALGFSGHLVLLLVLLMRHRATRFPLFTCFIAANVGRSLVLYVVLHYGSQHAYGLSYWSLSIVDLGLQLTVIYEIAAYLFRPLGHFAPEVRRAAVGLIAGSLLIASGLSWLAPPAAQTWQQAVVVRGSLFSTALMSELFVAMLGLTITIRLPWKTHVARIAQGLGVYSTMDILIEAGHSLFGLAYSLRVDTALTHIRIVAYLVCLSYWIITLYQDAPESKQLAADERLQLFALQKVVASQLAFFRHRRQ